MAEQMTMIQTLQTQMEELRQKGMEDRRQHEENSAAKRKRSPY